ncbi:tetratricopeptide repeat protein [Edaphobacter sp. HDX4]|uniref:tetratricopeptide repeat protein n=1 Tax=Edaphobacter sp. HDX4 TaxID=2794064 RepID=UPI002FE6B51A
MKSSFLPRRIGRLLVATLLGTSAACFIAALHTSTAYATNESPQTTQRHAYSQSTAEHYSYRFGAGQPFLPSFAATGNGEFIDPKSFPTAKYCGHCHQQAHDEWRQSAHANSFRTPWYTRNVNLLTQEKGVEFTRHCEGCHNPTALVSGALTKGSTVDRKFDEDGVTCSVCHSIQKTDTRGTGSYVLGQPAVLVDENGEPIYGEVSDKAILTHLDRHSQAVMKDFYRTSEYCSACHKAALPKQLNDYKWQRAIFLYDEWQQSSFSKQSPLPFYTKDTVSNCQTCHMRREELSLPDPGAKDGKLASHRWIGANTIMAKFYNYDVQFEKTVAFLRDNVFNIDIFGIEKNGGSMTAPLGTTPVTLKAGDTVTISTIIQNKGIAHSHVPEQRDMYESWVEFEAKDASGHVLSHSGALQANGEIDPRAHNFTNRLVNIRGGLNDLHQVWDTRVAAYNNTIPSGRSQIVRYQFRIPAGSRGPISITTRVNYRRFDQHFIDFAMQKQHYVQPVVVMASRTRTFQLGDNPAAAPDPADNPLWMRWNNYGIAMLDAQQYAESVRAFEQVAALRPDYPDAFTNVAIANFQWQRYDDSRTSLNKALALNPHSARALYYLALVERNQGNLDAAIANLREVAVQFPRSRDAHRELGFSYYQQHKYDEARAEYENVQGIDPDDLAAHYILSIVYRRLGMNDRAAHEAAMFADQKDDPTASTYALEYLRKHTEVANETVPWHTHSDLPVQPSTAKRDGTPAQ